MREHRTLVGLLGLRAFFLPFGPSRGSVADLFGSLPRLPRAFVGAAGAGGDLSGAVTPPADIDSMEAAGAGSLGVVSTAATMPLCSVC